MNPFDLLSEYAFIIIFLMIAFFQWFVSKFRNKGEDVFEWPEDDDDSEQARQQEEDPLAEIRRRLEERMRGGTAVPPPAPERPAEPQPTATPAPPFRRPQREPVVTNRENFAHKPRQGFVERERDALALKKSQLDAKTEALAASLEESRSQYGAKPDRYFASNRRGRVQKFLATPSTIRDAILLQEILGTPRSRRLL